MTENKDEVVVTEKTTKLSLYVALDAYIVDITKATVKREVARLLAEERGDDAAPPETRWVYFIQGELGGPIKIGVANDPKKRLSEFQRTSPVALRILAQEPGDIFRERQLHAQFVDDRLHGEWFTPSDAIQAYIDALIAAEKSDDDSKEAVA